VPVNPEKQAGRQDFFTGQRSVKVMADEMSVILVSQTRYCSHYGIKKGDRSRLNL